MIGISIRVVFVKHGHTPRGAIEVNHNLVVAMPRLCRVTLLSAVLFGYTLYVALC